MAYIKKGDREEAKAEIKDEGITSEFVTTKEFNSKFESLENSVLKLVDIMSQPKDVVLTGAPTAETINNKEILDAKANQTPVSPVWEEKAIEILGEKMDHCEVFYPKEGGTHFTVVIKNEYSNAPKDYLLRMKQDRRTREVSREGLEGVIKWCNLIKQNLSLSKK